jgi:hypothetical protein
MLTRQVTAKRDSERWVRIRVVKALVDSPPFTGPVFDTEIALSPEEWTAVLEQVNAGETTP